MLTHHPHNLDSSRMLLRNRSNLYGRRICFLCKYFCPLIYPPIPQIPTLVQVSRNNIHALNKNLPFVLICFIVNNQRSNVAGSVLGRTFPQQHFETVPYLTLPHLKQLSPPTTTTTKRFPSHIFRSVFCFHYMYLT